MANTKKFVAKNGLQTQNLDFVSNNESNTVTISIQDSGILSIEGNIKISNSLYDSNNLSGNVGEILTSTSNGVIWSPISGMSGIEGQSGYSGYSGYSGKDPVALRKTSNYTAVAGEILIADTTGGTFTITLPATPSVGNKVRIYDGGNWANTGLTIGRNGSTIEGYSDDFVLNIGQIYVDFVYDGTNWQLYGSIGKSGYSGYSGASSQAIQFDGGSPTQDYTNGPGFDAGGVT